MRSIRFSLLALGAVALLGLAAGSGQAQVAVLNPLVHQPPFAPSYVTPLSSYVAGYGIPQSPFRRSTYFGQYNAETVSYVRPYLVRSDLGATTINLRAAAIAEALAAPGHSFSRRPTPTSPRTSTHWGITTPRPITSAAPT